MINFTFLLVSDSASLSSATHMATCVAKKIENVFAVPVNYNGIPLFNPENISSSTIISKLTDDYKGLFDQSYNDIKSLWIKNEIIDEKDYDRSELLTVHIYDASIEEKKEERSMETVRLIDIKEQNLCSLEDYLSATKMITNINSLKEYIKLNAIPIIADFPGQLFIRKAITMYSKNQQSGIDDIQNFIPILGPLHVSLNARDGWKFLN